MAKLTKMKIVGFKDPEFKFKIGSKSDSEFPMQVNPEKYSFRFKSLSKEPKPLANSKEQEKASLPDVQTLDLSFFLDSTGVIPGCDSVPATIKKFHKICTDVNGSIHTANYLKIYWGELAFRCRLDTVQVDYLMFDSGGIPIRAELKTTFKKFVDAKTDATEDNNGSPDLSHVKVIRKGDSLPTLCHEVYGDPKYYLQVAEFNGIVNFKNLVPGQEVLFPRMQK